MKKYILYIIVISSVFSCLKKGKQTSAIPLIKSKTDCSYMNNVSSLGVGLLLWGFDCETKVIFYNDKEFKQKTGEYNFCGKTPICPLLYKPDYGIMHFVVTKANADSYEIVFNNTQKAFIAKTSAFTYFNWDSFFLQKDLSISPKDSNTLYKIVSVKGDFLNVINISNKREEILRWRKENKLLINIILLT